MIWNPLKKKQEQAAGDEPAAAAQMPGSDRTDPLIEPGRLEERSTPLTPPGAEVELEHVELWGPDGVTDSFLRLGCPAESTLAAGLRRMLLELPERATGFLDLLISDSHALRAKLAVPELSCAELPQLLDAGTLYLRPSDLIAGHRELAELLRFAGGLGLAPQQLTNQHIGLKAESHRIGGHAGWRWTFVGWDALAPGSAEDALARLDELFAGLAATLAKRARAEGLTAQEQLVRALADHFANASDDPVRLGAPLAQCYGATDVGRRREHNEDAYLIEQLDQRSAHGARLTLAAVADGMGGHASGEVASSLALALLRQQLSLALLAPAIRPQDVAQLPLQLGAIIPAIGRALAERATLDAELAGMGTTLVGLGLLEQQSTLDSQQASACSLFWVGDSRAYLLGPCGLRPLSSDHSYVQDLLDSGAISATEARSHQMKNVITRCLGGAGTSVEPEVLPFTPGPGEVVLLCSDGLTDALDDDAIWQVVRDNAASGWNGVLQALIDAANAAGGPDNITVLVVEFALRS